MHSSVKTALSFMHATHLQYKRGMKYSNLQISNQYTKPCLFYLFILKCDIIHNGLTFYNSINPAMNPTVIIFSFCWSCLREALIQLKVILVAAVCDAVELYCILL